MSKVINFPKTSEKHHQPSPESDQPDLVSYTETSWDSLAQEIPFNDRASIDPDSPVNLNQFPESTPDDSSETTHDDPSDLQASPEDLSTDFDDIANMLIQNNTADPEESDIQESETAFDRDTEAAIAGNFLSHLAIQLDKSKKPDERQKLTELTAIGEDYFGYIIDDEDDKTPAEIREHLAKKYDKLSKLYQRENRQRLASLYNYRANLTRTNFTDYYENFASTHGRDDVFEAKPDQPSVKPSVKPSPDALPTELII